MDEMSWTKRFMDEMTSHHQQSCRTCRIETFSACRYLLSDSYLCSEQWKSRLQTPTLQNVGDYMNFTMALREQLDQTGKASPIDIDILANKVTEIEGGQTEYFSEMLHKFRKSPDGLSMLESTTYAIIRNYIEMDKIEELLELLKNKHRYGLYPDSYSTCILIDHCIKKESFDEAVKMAYELMLQEDFSHKLSCLLSLYSCIHHSKNFPLTVVEETEEKPTEEEEEDWVPVKWIRVPYYDDHFDIQNEQFLLGKTLNMIGRTQEDLIGRSCQLMGLGLYEKFQTGLDLMEQFLSQKQSVAVMAVTKFEQTLMNAATRDPNAEKKELGFCAKVDELELLKCTPEEKTAFQERFQVLSKALGKSGLVEEAPLTDMVTTYVTEEIGKYEEEDIKEQLKLFEKWTKQRENLLKAQVEAILQEKKIKEVMDKLKELQKKEEVLKYFEKEDEIVLAQWKAPKEEKEEEIKKVEEDPEVLRAKRIARRKVRTNI